MKINRNTRKTMFSIAFITPSMLIYVGIVILPIIMSVYYSLSTWKGIGNPVFKGAINYLKMLGDKNFYTVITNNFILIALALCLQLPTGLILAYAVSRIKSGYKFFRSVFFLPVVLSASVTGMMFFVFYNDTFGPLNMLLDMFNLSHLKMNWLSDKRIVLLAVALPQLWQYIGNAFIIFLAGIQSIPEEIIESARIDGVGKLQMLSRIIIPSIREFLQIMIILTVTGCLKAFDHAYIITTGGPGFSSSYVAMYIFKRGFSESNFGYASALAVTMLIVSLVFTLVYKKIMDERYS